MRILYVSPYLHRIGGIQTFTQRVANYIKLRHELKVEDYQQDIDLRLVYLLSIIRSVTGLKFHQSAHLSHLQSYDLVHYWHIDSAIGTQANQYIVSCYGLEILPYSIPLGMHNVYERTFENASVIHACSMFTKKTLLKNFSISPDKIHVIYPPVSSTRKSKKPRITADINIGLISRFIKRKNIEITIRALEILYLKYKTRFIFHIAGTGSEKNLILKQLNKVTFKWRYWGEITDTQKDSEFYPNIDIFILTPKHLKHDIEGFGIVYIEANSFGIPVVGSNIEGVKEAIWDKNSGYLADPESPEEIASRLFACIKNRIDLSKNSILWAKKFSIKNIGDEFLRLYQLAVTENNRALQR